MQQSQLCINLYSMQRSQFCISLDSRAMTLGSVLICTAGTHPYWPIHCPLGRPNWFACIAAYRVHDQKIYSTTYDTKQNNTVTGHDRPTTWQNTTGHSTRHVTGHDRTQWDMTGHDRLDRTQLEQAHTLTTVSIKNNCKFLTSGWSRIKLLGVASPSVW